MGNQQTGNSPPVVSFGGGGLGSFLGAGSVIAKEMETAVKNVILNEQESNKPISETPKLITPGPNYSVPDISPKYTPTDISPMYTPTSRANIPAPTATPTPTPTSTPMPTPTPTSNTFFSSTNLIIIIIICLLLISSSGGAYFMMNKK